MSGVLGRLFGRRAPAPLAPGPLVPLFAPEMRISAPAPVQVPVPPEPVEAVGGWRACRLVARGGWVSASAEGALGVAGSLDSAVAVVAVVADCMPHLCLLVAPDGRAVHAAGDPMRAGAVSARILPTDARGTVRLKYPLGLGFLELGEAGLRFDGGGGTLLALFDLAALDAAEVPDAVRPAALALARAAAVGLRAAALLALLRQGRVAQGLAEPLLRLMPREEMDALARLLMASAADLAMLARAMPGDRWLAEVLPDLAAWAPKRPAVAGHIADSPAADEAMLLAASGDGQVPTGLALSALARRQMLPQRGLCILAAARNEGAYLLDWLSYHLSIGVEHAFIYTNENSDGSDVLLDLLAAAGVVTLVRNARSARIGPQIKGYTHALTLLPQILDYRWAAVIDVDEYIGFDTRSFASLGAFLAVQESQAVDAVALCWLLFAAMPDDRWSDAATPVRCTRRATEVQRHVKSVIRPRMFWHAQPHFPTAIFGEPFEFRSADGRTHHHPYVGGNPAEAPAPASGQAWVAHYILRTAEEALWKWGRGRGDLATADPESMRPLEFIADTFFDLARPEHQVIDTRISDCAAGQAAVLARLLALPGIAACDAEIKAAFAGELARTARAFLDLEVSGNAVHFKEIIKEGLLF